MANEKRPIDEERWMWDLLENVRPGGEGTDYIGNDFPRACIISEMTGNRIWEHYEHPGCFVVGEVPVLSLGMNGWIEHKIDDLKKMK